ncbi:hypothetical protein HXA31_20165 [Salipaludibacillus agaradhaerens]|uniref:hypothetical protein n=1 Tax=Salipaludibacillus TaxID=1884449 RepID=UPI0020D07300|nr:MULTISPECIES: hypothetical protein [Salipaludibacillus]MCR6116646.1 hypothetical protein [Salipaludibacillus agaradhaerens]UTR13477.1 hypothetical protein MM221_12650 [Salipaludibacillus sp. LMS25]
MSKDYLKVEFTLGDTIENAVNQLLKHKEKGQPACGDFNGVTLYSDTVTMDGAYKEITGMTKAEFDEYIK